MAKWMIEPIFDIKKQQTFMDRDLPLIMKGNKGTIISCAAAAMPVVADDAAIIMAGWLGIHDRKPLWWPGRETRIAEALGQPDIVKLALLMRRDLQEFFLWDGYLTGYLKAWLADKKSAEKRALLDEVGGYAMNAMHSARETAIKLLRMK